MNCGKYVCRECGGSGKKMCSYCEQEQYCLTCKGNGINISSFDFAEYGVSERVNWLKHGGTSWALIENEEMVGRAGGKEAGKAEWTLYFRDFPLEDNK